MAPDLFRVEAALNAYPWTAGTFTADARSAAGARYCALGLLARYSGVAQDHIAYADQLGAAHFWGLYGPLLRRDYGIPDLETATAVMAANDSAASHAAAIERVRTVLTLSGPERRRWLSREVAGHAGAGGGHPSPPDAGDVWHEDEGEGALVPA